MEPTPTDSLEMEERQNGASAGGAKIEEAISSEEVFKELSGLIKDYRDFTRCYDEQGSMNSSSDGYEQNRDPCLVTSSTIKLQNGPKERPLFELSLDWRSHYSSSLKEFEGGSVFSLIYRSENLMFSYNALTRYEYCLPGTVGTIQWRFDLSFIGDTWKRLAIRFGGMVSAGGSIELNLVAHNRSNSNYTQSMGLNLNSLNLIDAKQFKFCVGILDIIAVLKADDNPDEDDKFWFNPRLLCGDGKDQTAFLFEIY